MTYVRTFCILWPPFDVIPLWIGLCRANFFYSHSNLRQVADDSDIHNQLNMTGIILFRNYTRSAFWHHLWVHITFIRYNILSISYIFVWFLKAKFFYSYSCERQGPDMQDICSQWNMTGTISVKSYSVFWNYTFCKLWQSFWMLILFTS